ncbi:MAG TPA: hypothetical protein PKU93_01005 [Candidatus Pacearchaeota archaeon]|nr:hypothetical protein [Candidatus Pacearchaeota archaeon]
MKFEQMSNKYNEAKNDLNSSEQVREIFGIDTMGKEDIIDFQQKIKGVTKEKLISFVENYEFKNFSNLIPKEINREEEIEKLEKKFGKKILIEKEDSMPVMILNEINTKLELSLEKDKLPKIVSFFNNPNSFYNFTNNLIVIEEGKASDIMTLGEEIMHFYRSKIKKLDSDAKSDLFEDIAVSEIFGRLGEAFVARHFPELKEPHYNERRVIQDEENMKYLARFLDVKTNKDLDGFLSRSYNCFFSNIQEIFSKIPEIKKDFSIWEEIHLNYLNDPEKIDPSGLYKDVVKLLIKEMQLLKPVAGRWEEQKRKLEGYGMEMEEIYEPNRSMVISYATNKFSNIKDFFNEMYGHVTGYSIAELILEEYEEILQPENFKKLLSMSNEEILEIYKPFLRREIVYNQDNK